MVLSQTHAWIFTKSTTVGKYSYNAAYLTNLRGSEAHSSR